jgi:hypothetical protein
MTAVPTQIAGPAIVTFNSATWYSEDDIRVSIDQKVFPVPTSMFGNVGNRIGSLPVATISFKPAGQITTALAGKAFPYKLSDVGKTICSGTIIIWTLAGTKYTFARGGISQLPGMRLGMSTVFDGTMEMKAVVSGDPTTADTFVKVETAAYADTSWDDTKVPMTAYTAAYGTSPFAEIFSLDGFKVACPISVAEKSVDRYGIVDFFLTSVGPATCSFAPAGMTEANWKTLTKLDGASVQLPGVSAASGTTDLVITGTGLVVTLPKANLRSPGLAFGTAADRLGELTFESRCIFTVGVPAAPLTITVS